MSSVNKAILVGRLGRDPEFRPVGDKEVASMSLATDETYKDKNGEKQKKTQWHRLTSWISIDFIRNYLHAGDSIYVEGKIEYREWTDKDGVKKLMTEINVTDIRGMITARSDNQQSSRPATNNRPAARPAPQQRQAPSTQLADEDIPF